MRLIFSLRLSRHSESNHQMLWNHPQSQVHQQKTKPFASKVPSSDHTYPGYKAAPEAQYIAATFPWLHCKLFFCAAWPHCSAADQIGIFLNTGCPLMQVAHLLSRNPWSEKGHLRSIPTLSINMTKPIPESMIFTCPPLWHHQWFTILIHKYGQPEFIISTL